jgi:hypothetical protein
MSFLDIYKKINTFTYPLQKLYPERTVVWKFKGVGKFGLLVIEILPINCCLLLNDLPFICVHEIHIHTEILLT